MAPAVQALTESKCIFSDLLSCSGNPHFPECRIEGHEHFRQERNYGNEVRIQKWRPLIAFRQCPDLAFRIRESFLNS